VLEPEGAIVRVLAEHDLRPVAIERDLVGGRLVVVAGRSLRGQHDRRRRWPAGARAPEKRGDAEVLPHEEGQSDGSQRVAVQRQQLAERHGVGAPDVAGGRDSPREHLLAPHTRDDEEPGGPARAAVELQQAGARRRHPRRALVGHRGDVDEALLSRQSNHSVTTSSTEVYLES
jgi:hypothetical protein